MVSRPRRGSRKKRSSQPKTTFSSSESTGSTITCRNLWKIFGPHAKDMLEAHMKRGDELKKPGHVVAVKNVSFDVTPGEIFVVMGLSGSGKSTLVRCLSRLIEPTSGEIFVNDEDVLTMNRSRLRELRLYQMSMVFQRFGLFPHRRVIDNVAYGLEVQGVKKPLRLQRAREMVELVGLQGWERAHPHELSGGMQQRVGLARALAVDPEILLCDEPFSALDPLIRREMQDELLRLQRLMRKTIVFITHDFSEAVKLGNHIAIMKEGEIVQLDTPEQIMTYPATDYVREFARDVPRIRVLTAKSIMQPCESSMTSELTCSPDMTVEALIPLSLSSEQPIIVMDENHQALGTINRETVMMAMAEHS